MLMREMEYYKDSIDNKQIKHSDDELQSFLDNNSEELMHYGRLGMKWYQHIFGPIQSGAKYAQKTGQKLANAKKAHDAKEEAKWKANKEKIIRSGDPSKIRKYQTRMTDDELRRAETRIFERNQLDSMTGHGSKDKSARAAKADAKWQEKKEQIIRSGDPAQVRKYQNRLTDEELKRADKRISEVSNLDTLTGRDSKQTYRQVQNFMNQNNDKNSVDLIKSFGDVSSDISSLYKSFDTIMSTIDSAKKYTPAGRAREAEVKRAMSNLDMPWIIENVDKMTSKQREDVLKDYKNLNDIKIRYNDQQKQASSSTAFKDFMTDYQSRELTSFKEYQRFKDGYIPYTISDDKKKNK